jgi:hypothetical protein
MKSKPNLETWIYAVVIVLCVAAILLVAAAGGRFTDTKVVYQAF